jgi:hypothetical protein
MSVCEGSEDEEETCVEPRRRATLEDVIDRKMYLVNWLMALAPKTMQEAQELTEENPIFDRKMYLAHFLLALMHKTMQEVNELTEENPRFETMERLPSLRRLSKDVQNMET